jgi:hypothetical protein
LATTEIYTHLLAEVQRDTADKMDAIITGLRAPGRQQRESS